MSNNDTYYTRSEVSNSELTSLKQLLHPILLDEEVRQRAFRFGSLVDAMITESSRVNHYTLTVDDEQYSGEEFLHATEMYRSLRAEARHDQFLARVLEQV